MLISLGPIRITGPRRAWALCLARCSRPLPLSQISQYLVYGAKKWALGIEASSRAELSLVWYVTRTSRERAATTTATMTENISMLSTNKCAIVRVDEVVRLLAKSWGHWRISKKVSILLPNDSFCQGLRHHYPVQPAACGRVHLASFPCMSFDIDPCRWLAYHSFLRHKPAGTTRCHWSWAGEILGERKIMQDDLSSMQPYVPQSVSRAQLGYLVDWTSKLCTLFYWIFISHANWNATGFGN